ncbi:MAG: Gfo/Idh/MocA family oxidoreductase [Planctomycetes bacterium]|nr:Gfo/Idh/MocA family oxidoreductase [Planctomycetota bacterium]
MSDETTRDPARVSRRDFVKGAAAGAGFLLGTAWMDDPSLWALESQDSAGHTDELAVAIIGPGSQGRNLLTKCVKIPGIRFVAVCDVWPYHQSYAANILSKYDHQVNVYDDYREMLAKEPHLDAVIIATPDWVHAEQTNACLAAGKHVYCEKEMANSIDAARTMVVAARESGKRLQIGHQRRSNPRYWHLLKLVEKDKVLGRITHVYGQWNRYGALELGWPEKHTLDAETLARHGYASMEHFRNWRWYRRYSGGIMADLGSHQVDIFNWVLKTPPHALMASGGIDYYQDKHREWYDNVFAIYEYATPAGLVRGSYQVLNTTSHGDYYETFMGDEGSMVISEDPRRGHLFRERTAKRREWEDESETVAQMGKDAIELKIGQTLSADGKKDPEGQRLLEESKKPPHLLHLENFFNAIRTGTPLSCPPEVGFETAVSVLRANEAVEAQRRLEFDPSDFRVS